MRCGGRLRLEVPELRYAHSKKLKIGFVPIIKAVNLQISR